ncbi:DUF2800 domain-containing protein [Acinetobacter sp. FL51]|uniref:DUF2800 domain-containing protein n=1 Tax=Acinetobacter sp. FL51 TaxID=2777978 RepID=UPI0018E18AE4|nr:DUF2800 domain-containing protein [Acinetobacter sp. FL51]MBI1450353.1 DUF2800 domain-containing protein [Acinetobacter sp. FL51]
MSHAKFSPSAAHRWISCPGSLVMEKDLPNNSSVQADEGTAAHFLASECLEQNRNATDFLNCFIVIKKGNASWDQEASETRSGFIVDLEMAEYVQKYIDAIRSQADGNELLVEQRVDFSEFIGSENAFGTSDAIIICQNEIQVHDLKYGRTKVDAQGNEQLRLYGLGALAQFGLFGDFKQVRLVIHQPRIGHVSEEVASVEELYEFAHRAKNTVQMIKAIDLGQSLFNETDMLNPGEKQCHWCKAKATCPALTKAVMTTIAGEFDDLSTCDLEVELKQAIESVPSQENETLGKLYASLPLIEQWSKAVSIAVTEKLHNGEKVLGFKLVQGRAGNRSWANAEEAEQVLKSMRLKVEEMYDLKLISPTNAEKLQKAGTIGPRQWTKVENLIVRPDGKPTVAPESDKRPALEINPLNDFETV